MVKRRPFHVALLGVIVAMAWYAMVKYESIVKESSTQRRIKFSSLEQDIDSSDHVEEPRETAAVCLFEKFEDRYLEEWALYHLAIGFDHLYVYDNSPTNDTTAWLASISNEKLRKRMTVIDYSMGTSRQRQLEAQKECVLDQGLQNGHSWVAVIDADEFFVLKKHENVVDMLREVCPSNSTSCGSISFNWVTFGTSNQTAYNSNPVSDRFRYHVEEGGGSKTIVRPSQYRRQKNPHHPWLKNETMRINSSGKPFKTDPDSGPNLTIAAVYHYKTKSVEEYNQKYCTRGHAFQAYGTLYSCKKETKALKELPAGHIYDDTVAKVLETNEPDFWARSRSQS